MTAVNTISMITKTVSDDSKAKTLFTPRVKPSSGAMRPPADPFVPLLMRSPGQTVISSW